MVRLQRATHVSTFTTGDSNDPPNGNRWLTLDENSKYAYIVGFLEGGYFRGIASQLGAAWAARLGGDASKGITIRRIANVEAPVLILRSLA